jgi:hypothetical protein
LTQGSGNDYTWIPERYPVPTHLPDLEQQVSTFLETPPPLNPPCETLWIFSYGYWEVWKLAAMPREIAKGVLERQVEQLFLQIERVYNKAKDGTSIAYSSYCTTPNITGDDKATSRSSILNMPVETFRVLIPSLFDISLTPGFETVRPTPPYPHTKAKEMGNAAYLTEEWENMITSWIGSWTAIPDLLINETTKDTALIKGDDGAGWAVYKTNARREAIMQDISNYIKELIVDRQLRDSELVDSNGLGSKPIEVGFLEVWKPCTSAITKTNATSITNEKTLARSQMPGSICSLPNEHLFWTEFTLGQRAIAEIGKTAANLFRMHVVKAQYG